MDCRRTAAGMVEVVFTDADGRLWRFFDKPPMFESPTVSISKNSSFPVAAVLRLTVIEDGNPMVVTTRGVGSEGVVAGIVGYPGLSKIALSESSVGTFDVGQALPSPAVQVVDGVSFFIGTVPESACDYPSLELNTTSPGVSAEHNLGFGTCVANELVPITESQGIWQLPPGQFQTSLGGRSSAPATPATAPTTGERGRSPAQPIVATLTILALV